MGITTSLDTHIKYEKDAILFTEMMAIGSMGCIRLEHPQRVLCDWLQCGKCENKDSCMRISYHERDDDDMTWRTGKVGDFTFWNRTRGPIYRTKPNSGPRKNSFFSLCSRNTTWQMLLSCNFEVVDLFAKKYYCLIHTMPLHGFSNKRLLFMQNKLDIIVT